MSLSVLVVWLRARVNSDRGASLVEYSLLLACLAVVCVAALTFLGAESDGIVRHVGNHVADPNFVDP